MALTDDRKQTLMTYCKVYSLTNDEEALLEGLYLAAVGYMTDAGVCQPEAGSSRAALYDLCVNFMVLDGWDNREMTVSGAVQDNPAFRRMLNQLKLTEPVPDSGTA